MNIRRSWVVLLLVLSAHVAFAGTITIDFEGLADQTSVTNQYPGFLFGGATILSAGVSLNAGEFPPHSGINVVFDDGGPISISFSAEIVNFEAYFTYTVPLTATALDAGANQVDVAASLYGSNLAFSTTNPPNELISLSSAGGISEVVVAGDPNGASFVMDDVTVTTPGPSAVPEPSMSALVAGFLVLMFVSRRARLAAPAMTRRMAILFSRRP